MKLTDDQVNEFIEITKRVFHRTLSPEEARTIATRFLLCLELLARGPRKRAADRDDGKAAL